MRALFWSFLYYINRICVKFKCNLIICNKTGNEHINLILRDVRVTIVTVEKTIIITRCEGVCSLSYPAFAKPILYIVYIFYLYLYSYYLHVLYCHLWPILLYHIFPHYLSKGTIFGEKKAFEYKMCFWIFCTKFVWKNFHSKKNPARYYKYAWVFT